MPLSYAYTYDGTIEGLMTAIYQSYAHHVMAEDIVMKSKAQPRLDQDLIDVETDMDLALKVRRGICRQLGTRVWKAIAEASSSDEHDTGTIVYRFIRYALESPNSCPCKECNRKTHCMSPCKPGSSAILDEWSNPAVRPLLQLQRHVLSEAELMRQFIRFEKTEDGCWFARCNPNASVVPLVMSYFSARFNTQDFVIYDEAHHLAGISHGGRWQLVSADKAHMSAPSVEEASMQDAWKRFYHALSVECRYHPEQRRSFMPQRLWRNITEMK